MSVTYRADWAHKFFQRDGSIHVTLVAGTKYHMENLPHIVFNPISKNIVALVIKRGDEIHTTYHQHCTKNAWLKLLRE